MCGQMVLQCDSSFGEELHNQDLLYHCSSIYPNSIIALASVSDKEAIKEQAMKDAIPEFLQFNIIEGEVRDVV